MTSVTVSERPLLSSCCVINGIAPGTAVREGVVSLPDCSEEITYLPC